MAVIADKARELGRLIGQSDEHKALQRAQNELDQASELRLKLDRLTEIAERLDRAARDGQEPSDDAVPEYERVLGEIQADPRYQRFVAARSNYEKLLVRVNEHLAEGMEKGAQSSIITLG